MDRAAAITSLRTALEWLGDDVKRLEAPVDPEIEATGIAKALDGGPALSFEHIRGYPNARYIGNLWTERSRIAKLAGAVDYGGVKHRIIEAVQNPIPPVEVGDAPVQEVVLDGAAADPFKLFPMVRHTHLDGGRF